MPNDNPSNTWDASRLKALRRDGYCCRSCGKKARQIPLEAVPLRPGDHRLHAVVTLCAGCRSLIELLRQNKNVTAIFFYRRRAGIKRYVMLS